MTWSIMWLLRKFKETFDFHVDSNFIHPSANIANPEPTCQEATTLRGEVIRGMDKAEPVTQYTVSRQRLLLLVK